MKENKNDFKPYIPADQVVPEFTVTALILGILLAAITAMSAIWNVVKDFFFVVVTADMIISSLKCIVKNKTGSIIKEVEQIVNQK